jgi:hypothetical protein
MTLDQLQQMIDAAKQDAESNGEVNAPSRDFEISLQDGYVGTVESIDFVSGDTNNPRFVMTVSQVHP